MTRIDFHSAVGDQIAYACRVTRKAHAAACNVVLVTPSAEIQEQLDRALWTFSNTDFLPHECISTSSASAASIVIARENCVSLPHHELLINLCSNTPNYFARFERLIEIIDSDHSAVAAARARWLFYKDRGYRLTHFAVDKS